MHYKATYLPMLFHLIKICIGGGTISIRLTNYNNVEGKGDNGNCCESSWQFACQNPCDHYFIVCLDRLGGPPAGVDHCPLGQHTTGAIGKNMITFTNSIGGKPNPIKFPFRKWQGGFLLKVQVWDSDPDNRNDFVDSFSVNVALNATRNGRREKAFKARKRTELNFKVTVACDENWFGPTCEENCYDDLHDNKMTPGAPGTGFHCETRLAKEDTSQSMGKGNQDSSTHESRVKESSTCATRVMKSSLSASGVKDSSTFASGVSDDSTSASRVQHLHPDLNICIWSPGVFNTCTKSQVESKENATRVDMHHYHHHHWLTVT